MHSKEKDARAHAIVLPHSSLFCLCETLRSFFGLGFEKKTTGPSAALAFLPSHFQQRRRVGQKATSTVCSCSGLAFLQATLICWRRRNEKLFLAFHLQLICTDNLCLRFRGFFVQILRGGGRFKWAFFQANLFQAPLFRLAFGPCVLSFQQFLALFQHLGFRHVFIRGAFFQLFDNTLVSFWKFGTHVLRTGYNQFPSLAIPSLQIGLFAGQNLSHPLPWPSFRPIFSCVCLHLTRGSFIRSLFGSRAFHVDCILLLRFLLFPFFLGESFAKSRAAASAASSNFAR